MLLVHPNPSRQEVNLQVGNLYVVLILSYLSFFFVGCGVWCQDVKTADWSENVAPFWPAVIKSALTWKGITSLLTSGMLLTLLVIFHEPVYRLGSGICVLALNSVSV